MKLSLKTTVLFGIACLALFVAMSYSARSSSLKDIVNAKMENYQELMPTTLKAGLSAEVTPSGRLHSDDEAFPTAFAAESMSGTLHSSDAPVPKGTSGTSTGLKMKSQKPLVSATTD
eukprot:gnl/MRDRNA2_/MRDRNA2_98432_c0_seq1.p1 gnl/MRDRNA2_/MRDRNA2_98432_c0~~gnl/MRDRNA2_/MRDRNA2_98432_c0_seq1.p1  ORF type:complete len:117 (+),score=29.33 gnl/MRDRNA2_/MRDRNA2_98432_c0_seq1:73-423(+)